MVFSIIVPIYNCEQYLTQCLDSVVNQTYQNWELILVDDGSTDDSAIICERYKRQLPDKNIKFIRQKNQGVSVARNVGLDHAEGNYIVFLDSDDWLDKDTLQYCFSQGLLYGSSIDCFVGMFNTHFETENATPIFTEKLERDNIDNRTRGEVLTYFHHLRLIMTVWRFIVKRSVIEDNGMRFIPGLLHEDEVFASLLLTKCDVFHHVPIKWYHYRIRNNSITTTKTIDNYECYIRVADLQLQAAKAEPEGSEKQLFLLRCCGENLNMAKGGIDYFAKPLWLIPEGRKLLGLKELM